MSTPRFRLRPASGVRPGDVIRYYPDRIQSMTTPDATGGTELTVVDTGVRGDEVTIAHHDGDPVAGHVAVLTQRPRALLWVHRPAGHGGR